MDLKPGIKITPDMLASGESNQVVPSNVGLQSGMKITPDMLLDSSVMQAPRGNEFVNTLSDIGQAVSNPIDLIAGTMRSGFEQAIGGFQQKIGEQQLVDITRGQRPLRTFAGITEEDPLANAEGYQAGIARIQDTIQAGKDLYAEGQALDQGLREAFPQKSYLGGIARGVTSSVGFQLPVMAAAIINPALAIPFTGGMFVATAGQKYGERRADGFDIETAQRDANFQGTVEVLTEMGGAYFMGKFFEAAKAGLPVLKPFVKNLVSEVVGESAATTLQGSNDFVREDKANKITDYVLSKRHIYDQIDTLASVLMQSGVTGGVGAVQAFDSKQRASKQIVEIDKLIDSLSKTGDAGVKLEDGTLVSVGELRRSKAEIQKEFKLGTDKGPAPVVETIEDIPADLPEIAARVAEMVTSPVLSTTERAAKAVERLSEIEVQLAAIDPTTATEAQLEEGGRLQRLKERVQRGYENIQQELGGESSPFEPAKIDSIQNSNSILDPVMQVEKANEVVRGMIDHFANETGDTTVYQSPKMLAQGNFIEDLLLSSGIKSKVALLDITDIESSTMPDGDLLALRQRLTDTKNFGVVKEVRDADGRSRWIAVVNSPEILKGRKSADTMHFTEAAIHEAFGHVVVGERYALADEATKASLEKDFQRFTKLPADEASKAFYPLKTGEIAIGVPEGMSERTQFEEWLVNGITKWATSEAEPIGLANKWFKKVADAFKKAFAKEGAAQTPESIRIWMNSMFDSSRLADKTEAMPTKIIEPHGGYKKLSLSKQIEKLKKAVPVEELKAYEIGKIEGKDETHLGVYRKDKSGNKVLINQISSTSRSSAQREANLFKYAHALASRGLAEPLTSSGARVKFYREMLSSFKDEVQEIANKSGQSFEQTWLEFIGDTNTFSGFVSLKDKYLNMSLPGRKIFDKLLKIADHNPSALRKAILYEKRVIPKEVQELEKAEEVLKEEIAEATIEQPKQDTVQNSNLNFEDRIRQSAQESALSLIKVGSKVNLDRITSSVIEKLRLSGKDAKEAKKFIKENYEALRDGKEISKSVVEEVDRVIESQKIPDEVSLEEAQAYMDGLSDMAVRRKSKPIEGPLYEKVKKIKKARKDTTPEQASEKIRKRLAKEAEFVQETSKLEEAANKANVSLTEYLRAVGKDKEGNPLSEDTIAKILRKYQRLAKTIFTDQEHILRLGTALGLVDGVTGVAGLEAYIKTIFPKAQGPLKQLTITGRDILMKRMQDRWFELEGQKFDFSKIKTFRELVNLSREERASLSGWKRFKAGLAYYIQQNTDEIATTPAGSSLVHLLKNVLNSEAALYTRDYPARLQRIMELVTDPKDREHILDVYEGKAVARNKVFQEGADLMREIYHAYGTEMERLGVRIQYKGGYTSEFKFDPNANHYPHMWEPGSFDKPSEKMLNSLLVSGQPVDAKQAAAIIKSYGSRATRLSAPKFANLEMAREIEMEGYIRDPLKVTMQYLMSGAKRLALLREVGQQPEVRLAQLAWDHFQQSGDADSYNFAVKIINSITGVPIHERLMEKSGWMANPLEFAALAATLQHSAFVQPGVLANTITVAGFKRTAEGIRRYIKADPRKKQMSKEWAETLGANGRSVTKELLDEMHDSLSLATKMDKLMHFWRIPQVDTFFRNSATLTGRLHINEMVERSLNLGDKKAEQELRRLGLSSQRFKELLEQGKDELVEDELRKGAYAFAQRTNLVNDALTKAQWTMEHSSFSRMLTLLGRFSFQQHHFLKSLYKDDPKKLVKYLGVASAIGVPGYVAKTLMKGKNPIEDAKERGLFGTWIAMLQNAAGLGMFMDMTLDGLTQVVTGKQGHAADRVGGPLPGLAKDTLVGASKIAHGDLSSAAAMRLLLRSGVVVSAGALPPKYGVPIAGTLGLARPAIETFVKENK